MKKNLCMLFISGLFGCSGKFKSSAAVDMLTFRLIADTIFEKPKIVGFKEIHLSNDVFLNKLVQVKGIVVERGDLGTFIIIAEDDDRLIIATTDLLREFRQNLSVGSDISVLGTVESGKKGMPFLRAQSIKLN